MVSHEMRNPLNAIIQCAEEASQLIEGHTTKECKPMSVQEAAASLDAVNTILYCGHHQKQIIDDVLTISKLDSNLLTLCPTETRPAAIAQQALQIYNSSTRASDIDVSVTQDQNGMRETVMLDAGRILQILINLVGNAIKFLKNRPTRKLNVVVKTTRERPAPAEVTFVPSGSRRRDFSNPPGWEERRTCFVYYSIIDTGPGLSQEETNDLFGRFKQASPRTHAQYGGSGLGLFISRELAELHGGEIGLSSVPGKGSTFAFYVQGYVPTQSGGVPAVIPDVKAVIESNLSSLAASVQPSIERTDPVNFSDNEQTKPNTSVLVVEDNQINQNVLVRQLKRAGFGTFTADNGEEALARIRESTWYTAERSDNDAKQTALSMVLCDLEMPVMDGLTCVKKVREMQRAGLLEHVPMVAVTGNARSEQVQNARDAGFDDVVCKPYSIAKLVPLIKEMALKR